MPVKGTRIVARNIIRYGNGFLKTVNLTMKQVEFMLDKQVGKNISLQDHSLQQLASLDHPYAARHGSQGKRIHDPYWLVHRQSGKLLASKKSGTTKASVAAGKLTATAFVELDSNVAPHALNVIFGTSRMVPRPVLIGSREQIIDAAMKLVQGNLKFLTVNFR